MIDISNISTLAPFKNFLSFYNLSLEKGQKNIEAMSISSFNNILNEVDSRFVNAKYIIDESFIFFSNYSSPKAKQFDIHKQVSILFYWNTTDTQIRIKGIINKCDESFSDNHFLKRSNKKNAIAVSSYQSMPINSYKDVLNNHQRALNNYDFNIRPSYWGGFSVEPFSIEFWKGDISRINKRDIYIKDKKNWKMSHLQP